MFNFARQKLNTIAFMKRLLSLLGTVLLTVPMFGQNSLSIFQKDGLQFSFVFDDEPVIRYTDTDLILETTKTEVQYPLSLISKFNFTDVETEIETAVIPIKEDENAAKLELDNNMVVITGAKADASVTVTGPDGKTVGTYKTDADGCVTFSIADLPQGLYIINSENLTCKILKK